MFLGPNRPGMWFRMARRLGVGFILLNRWEKKQKTIFCDIQRSYEVQTSVFYWNTAMPVCFHLTCGCFHTVKAEWSPWGRDIEAHKFENIYSLSPYREILLFPILGCLFHYYPPFTDEEMEAESFQFVHVVCTFSLHIAVCACGELEIRRWTPESLLALFPNSIGRQRTPRTSIVRRLLSIPESPKGVLRVCLHSVHACVGVPVCVIKADESTLAGGGWIKYNF